MSTVNGFLLLCVFFVLTRAQEQQKMTFETPKMTEEEQHSPHTPSSFEIQCDSCTAIAYKLTQALAAAEAKRPSLKGKPLSESEYLDIIEGVCESKAWDDYGIKTVNGVNRISGEGLEAKDFPGMMQGGGKWPGRLSSKCSGIVGDVSEDTLYEKFRESGDLHEYICKEYTKDCVKQKKNKKEKKSKKSKKSKEGKKEEL
ncbi:marginal zone B- and B1-cell-specific protein-like [Actinia tenebrosa]|uniref:Marginal zone B- and B1-cell-specific protein-like n=1 Tax=Actinia tenebrosa TaxID=6105 RepID=A0A6P8HKK5_ACTTE|nr:marginal zone B- and B1-cell-specific protein-like [Actinia tenebrosa]